MKRKKKLKQQQRVSYISCCGSAQIKNMVEDTQLKLSYLKKYRYVYQLLNVNKKLFAENIKLVKEITEEWYKMCEGER